VQGSRCSAKRLATGGVGPPDALSLRHQHAEGRAARAAHRTRSLRTARPNPAQEPAPQAAPAFPHGGCAPWGELRMVYLSPAIARVRPLVRTQHAITREGSPYLTRALQSIARASRDLLSALAFERGLRDELALFCQSTDADCCGFYQRAFGGAAVSWVGAGATTTGAFAGTLAVTYSEALAINYPAAARRNPTIASRTEALRAEALPALPPRCSDRTAVHALEHRLPRAATQPGARSIAG
jgi:hypothetical protein